MFVQNSEVQLVNDRGLCSKLQTERDMMFGGDEGSGRGGCKGFIRRALSGRVRL